ncbi:MAG TPA: alpha-E domain-containing protein [Candidatus Acidoferrales bacterium]|nr:alpha-E domain-containing protein [Candidatus Acidoferrales bacterium]
MLSRVADSLFWMGRNVERAETIARILDVNYNRAMDLYSTRDGRYERLWRSVMNCAGFVNEPKLPSNGQAASEVFAHCAFGTDNTASIASSIRIARTNALGIRADLSTEVWLAINVLYLYAESQNVTQTMREGPSRFLRRVRDAAQAFAGVSDATLLHGDEWNYLQIGRFQDRLYMTARMLGAVDIENEPWPEAQRLLEMCCAMEPFMQVSHQQEPRDVLSFIILSEDFPRSLRFCAREIDRALHRLSQSPVGTYGNEAERRLGRLRAMLDFTPVDEMLSGGVSTFAALLIEESEHLSRAIVESYAPPLQVQS